MKTFVKVAAIFIATLFVLNLVQALTHEYRKTQVNAILNDDITYCEYMEAATGAFAEVRDEGYDVYQIAAGFPTLMEEFGFTRDDLVFIAALVFSATDMSPDELSNAVLTQCEEHS